jgi:hypothetical protein
MSSLSLAGRLPTDDLAGSLGLWCVRDARREVTEDGATSATDVQHGDHRNALDGNALQKTPVLDVAQAQTATCPAVAPKLHQIRFKYSASSGETVKLVFNTPKM